MRSVSASQPARRWRRRVCRRRPPGCRPTATSRSSSSATPAKAMRRSTCCATRCWQAAGQPDVKFVVISSDVVYPTGAMRNYETNFWLPFKGVRVPVYAIPGNHDWYDALEGVRRDLPRAGGRQARDARARRSRRAASPPRPTPTSTHSSRRPRATARSTACRSRISGRRSSRSRPIASRSSPSTPASPDASTMREWAWLESALEAARGKFVMAVLGHPLTRAVTYLADPADDDPRASRRFTRCCAGTASPIVMAGDTHDLEYYAERPAPGAAPIMHHLVNGGGGAYLSFGTALAWPRQPATTHLGALPGTWPHVATKIEASTPWWKRPAWWWTRDLGAGRSPPSGCRRCSTPTRRRSSRASSRSASSRRRSAFACCPGACTAGCGGAI